MIRRIIFIILLICGIGLLFAPLLDEIQHRDYYTVKNDGTWQEPPNPNVCNTHAANVTGTTENHNCLIFYVAFPVGLIFAGGFFGLLNYRLPFEKEEK